MYTCKDGADISTEHKHTLTGHKSKKDALQHNYSRQAEKLSFYNM